MSFSGEKEDHLLPFSEKLPPGEPSSRVCPTCGRDLPESLYARQIFCSRSCREIDLMKWLNEEYRLPLDDHSFSEGETDEGE
ncbi:MAG: DNA gyrase inhibitor YacG [Leptospirillum sp.]